MQDFRGKLAVVTGAGTGMGRELALQLVQAGAHIAICDIFEDTLQKTKAACESAAAQASQSVRVSAHRCDVSDEQQVRAFRDAVLREHATDHVELLFNNAGIGGGGSFLREPREQWERTFNVCWFGVYYCARAFLPLLVASSEACIVNISSINGVFAYAMSGAHTAYSTAKFAVKGFTEALLTDLRLNAPHVKAVLVMPGHIGTSIVTNTLRSQGMKQPRDMDAGELAQLRDWFSHRQLPHEGLDDEQLREQAQKRFDSFAENAPVSAAQAAGVILDAVRTGRWRVLIGDDAKAMDAIARERPEQIYEAAFLDQLRSRVGAGR